MFCFHFYDPARYSADRQACLPNEHLNCVPPCCDRLQSSGGANAAESHSEAGAVTIAASRVLVGKGKTERDDPKSAASMRTVAVDEIHPGTSALFRALKASQAADRLAAGRGYLNTDDLVVVDRTGAGIHPDAFTARFHAICRTAGVSKIGIHSARHSLALTLHRGGVAPVDAAALLGHTITTHLTYYVPKTERGAASAARRLGEVFAAVQWAEVRACGTACERCVRGAIFGTSCLGGRTAVLAGHRGNK